MIRRLPTYLAIPILFFSSHEAKFGTQAHGFRSQSDERVTAKHKKSNQEEVTMTKRRDKKRTRRNRNTNKDPSPSKKIKVLLFEEGDPSYHYLYSREEGLNGNLSLPSSIGEAIVEGKCQFCYHYYYYYIS